MHHFLLKVKLSLEKISPKYNLGGSKVVDSKADFKAQAAVVIVGDIPVQKTLKNSAGVSPFHFTSRTSALKLTKLDAAFQPP
ncbi:MAG: hypothetical protein VR72_04595 [Clostridiaceae bacterium BRH_c20a]|nr:MAG: hypothetical protein VR72_04595 [Clostridiaceae bacterium BRH_c20a]